MLDKDSEIKRLTVQNEFLKTKLKQAVEGNITNDPIVNRIIRKHINFNGIIISDDISMKSLKGKLELNALNALKAGCNLVLHCNGNMNEMIKVAKVVPKIDNFTIKKTSHFYNFLI